MISQEKLCASNLCPYRAWGIRGNQRYWGHSAGVCFRNKKIESNSSENQIIKLPALISTDNCIKRKRVTINIWAKILEHVLQYSKQLLLPKKLHLEQTLLKLRQYGSSLAKSVVMHSLNKADWVFMAHKHTIVSISQSNCVAAGGVNKLCMPTAYDQSRPVRFSRITMKAMKNTRGSLKRWDE